MSNKAEKMAALARQIGATPTTDSKEAAKPETQKAVKRSARRGRAGKAAGAAVPMPARSAGALKQMTIKLEPAVRSRLLEESLKRKSADSPDWSIQQIVTEAVNHYLGER